MSVTDTREKLEAVRASLQTMDQEHLVMLCERALDVICDMADKDQTPEYAYKGQRGHRKDRLGKEPENVGSKWMTPREMAWEFARWEVAP
jgi:hypothetical protein